MPGIVPQHEYYGLPHVEAAALPSEAEIADALRPVGIQAGMLNREAGHFDGHEDDYDDGAISHHDCNACANDDHSGRFLSHPDCEACAERNR